MRMAANMNMLAVIGNYLRIPGGFGYLDVGLKMTKAGNGCLVVGEEGEDINS